MKMSALCSIFSALFPIILFAGTPVTVDNVQNLINEESQTNLLDNQMQQKMLEEFQANQLQNLINEKNALDGMPTFEDYEPTDYEPTKESEEPTKESKK